MKTLLAIPVVRENSALSVPTRLLSAISVCSTIVLGTLKLCLIYCKYFDTFFSIYLILVFF